jgi:hypothetical protein
MPPQGRCTKKTYICNAVRTKYACVSQILVAASVKLAKLGGRRDDKEQAVYTALALQLRIRGTRCECFPVSGRELDV